MESVINLYLGALEGSLTHCSSRQQDFGILWGHNKLCKRSNFFNKI